MSTASPTPSPQLIAGRYRIISQLGEGGMGVAFRAWDNEHAVPVVVKMPRADKLSDPRYIERFNREIKAMAGLVHPHIVPIVGHGQDSDGRPYVVMRFLPGGSLENRRNCGPDKQMPHHHSLLHYWLPAISDALDFVHRSGVVHRDVKPANIFFDARWNAFLGDFGVAKVVETGGAVQKDATMTAAGPWSPGTRQYQAPEVFNDISEPHAAWDQYALAITVYELLAGVAPFTSNFAFAHMAMQVPSLKDKQPQLPGHLCDAVHRALSKKPEERFETCSEFAAAVLQGIPAPPAKMGVTRVLCPAPDCHEILFLDDKVASKSGKCRKCNTPVWVSADLEAVWLHSENPAQAGQGDGGVSKTPSSFGGSSSPFSGGTSDKSPSENSTVRQAGPVDLTPRRFLIGVLIATAFLIAFSLPLIWREGAVLLPEMKQHPAASRPAPSPLELQPPRLSTTNSIGITLLEIPAGRFQMGESGVAMTLTRPIWLGKTEVTQGQWETVMGTKPWSGEVGKSNANLPATSVNWSDVTEFCKKLTQHERGSGKLPANEEYRLPTEAEWEYACRAGSTTAFSFGDDESKLANFAWFNGNSEDAAHKVGSKQANPWGLHDMHGNVWEWCSDWHDGKLAGGADPVGPGGGSDRVLRGGGWRNDPVFCRSAFRFNDVPLNRSGRLGFRVARSQSAPVAERRPQGAPAEPAPQIAAAERPIKLKKNSIGIALLEIPAGKFQMGEGGSAVTVTLARPFWLGKTEVTQGQWETVMGTKPWSGSGGKSDADLPATCVNWDDVTEFCKRLTRRERDNGKLPANEEYRLPTEAEWEYACRAGTTTAYSFGNEESKLGEFCWFLGNSRIAAHAVETKQANPWGLHDMHGNVWEWCSDWYGESLAGGADPVGPGGGVFRVFRGGGWGFNPMNCRSASRGNRAPADRLDYLGFRVTRSQSATVAERPVKLETNSIGIALLEIPAGKVQMGEGGVAVSLTRPFWLGKTEVTQGVWQKVMGIRPGDQAVGKSDADLPALNVTWDEVTEFCKKLTQLQRGSGKLLANEEYRLPTEAEWEYACRAGTTTAYSFGNDESKLGDFGWFSGNSGSAVHKVGTKQANPWGLHDMHGNVLEWCSDWYDVKLTGGADPVGPRGGSLRVNRGGGWRDYPMSCRSVDRSRLSPSLRNGNLGFRVARSQSAIVAERPIKLKKNSIGIALLEIPAGKFQMGEGDSAVAVTLPRPFWLGKTEVTQGQWEQVMGTKPWSGEVGKSWADLPATHVNWDEVIEFCKKLTQRERGNGKLPANEEYRPPTEAEWEYACRAGTTTTYSFGDDESKLGDFGWSLSNSSKAVHAVGTKQPNPWGLHDMHGNVWEWCSDLYDGSLSGGADPVGPGSGSNRVNRGGSWWNDAAYCRPAYRRNDAPSNRSGTLGFRVARSSAQAVDAAPD